MIVRWEYLSLIQEKRTEKRMRPATFDPFDEHSRLRLDRPTEEVYWHQTHTFFIWRPGSKKAEERAGWSTDNDKPGGALPVLNELGAEGWELVDRSTVSSSSGSSRLGWAGAAWPVEIIWTLKRPIAEEQ